MRFVKKVRGTVEASESFRGKLVKTKGKEASCCRTSCIYRGEEDQSLSIRSSSESKMACMKRDSRRSIYSSKESRKDQRERRMKNLLAFDMENNLLMKKSLKKRIVNQISTQCEEGCFKAIEGNAKEYQIRGMELTVVVTDINKKDKKQGKNRTKPSKGLERAWKTEAKGIRAHKQILIDLDDYDEDEAQAKRMKRMVQCMCTRSSGPVVEPSTTLRRRRNKKHSQQLDPTIVEKPVVTMADTHTMAELLQAPTEDLLRACPHHGFTELHQIDTFYNSLTSNDQDSLNAATGGNLLTKTPKEALTLIENKSKVYTSRNRPVVAKVSTNTSTSGLSPDVATLTDAVKALLFENTTLPPTSVKAVEESFVTCGGPHPYYQCLATDGNASGYQDNIQAYVSAAAINYNQGNAGHRPPSVAH
ncbi:hypothetical protein Tco_1569835 [Tanacetum coccineum]